jgi:hypothetical protein
LREHNEIQKTTNSGGHPGSRGTYCKVHKGTSSNKKTNKADIVALYEAQDKERQQEGCVEPDEDGDYFGEMVLDVEGEYEYDATRQNTTTPRCGSLEQQTAV